MGRRRLTLSRPAFILETSLSIPAGSRLVPRAVTARHRLRWAGQPGRPSGLRNRKRLRRPSVRPGARLKHNFLLAYSKIDQGDRSTRFDSGRTVHNHFACTTKACSSRCANRPPPKRRPVDGLDRPDHTGTPVRPDTHPRGIVRRIHLSKSFVQTLMATFVTTAVLPAATATWPRRGGE